ncbi:hypothetical protein QQS21_004858 [Conoideocrella luteorostrata]|uniref:Uncharacterized protein n=1 Tax=Conoideocrella luteorostrata TaxID=1105319 RepID=A0AAJ0CQL3_9HYPO|nr:hypothetical protein QQS21_004858 [Conoideocrella luteorostrata]
MNYSIKFNFLLAVAVICAVYIVVVTGTATPRVVANNTLRTIAKRGNSVGELDEGTSSSMYNNQTAFQCGFKVCFSPTCIASWADTHGCKDSNQIDGICADIRDFSNTPYKEICGDSWMMVCEYTDAYIATFLWNGQRQLSATATKRDKLDTGYNSDAGKSCKYGMLVSDKYTGSFLYQDLLDNFRSMLDTIPVEGC